MQYLSAAEAAKKWHQQVSRIERSGYEEGEVAMWLANSNGILQHQAGTYCGLFCLALGEKNGEQQSGYGMDSGISLAALSPTKAGTWPETGSTIAGCCTG